MGKRSRFAKTPGSTAWLIRPEWLERIKAALTDDSMARFAAATIDPGDGWGMPDMSQGNIAEIRVNGVISRYADFWNWLFGGTSVEEIDEALTVALGDPSVNSIVLRVNSPGGVVSGVAELARKIRAASDKKKIVAYIDGDSASAAYWLTAAASEIVINETGWAGSIGAYYLFYDDTKALADEGIREIKIVSSQSPNKIPDPTTEEGAAKYQSQVDAIAQVFIDSVARYRGVTSEAVVERFGAGDVFIGAEAVERGLADRVGVLETALDLVGQEISHQGGTRAMTTEEIRTQFPDVASALLAEGAAAERARIKAIEALGVSDEDRGIIEAAVSEGISPADTALKVLAAQKSRKEKLKADRTADAEALGEAAGASNVATEKTEAELAAEEGKKIAAAAPKKGKGR